MHRKCCMWVPARFLLVCIPVKDSWSKCSSPSPARQGVLILRIYSLLQICFYQTMSSGSLCVFFYDCFVLKLCGASYCLRLSPSSPSLSSTFPLLLPSTFGAGREVRLSVGIYFPSFSLQPCVCKWQAASLLITRCPQMLRG